jgi:hypothetical protein
MSNRSLIEFNHDCWPKKIAAELAIMRAMERARP